MEPFLRRYLDAIVGLLAANLAASLVLLPMVASPAPLPSRLSVFVAILVLTVLVVAPIFGYVWFAGSN